MPASRAGRKCSSLISPNGGTLKGVVKGFKSGFSSTAELFSALTKELRIKDTAIIRRANFFMVNGFDVQFEKVQFF
jgi:hypothetical protein